MCRLNRQIITFSVCLLGLVLALQAYCTQALGSEFLAYSRGGAREAKLKAAHPIVLADLPTEALTTLTLIKQGGPFPYPKDGTTFSNREGRLPMRPDGYYKEYTVATPGARDRGARRIIAGSRGEFYYSDDHYRTFRLVKE
jgi:ribonuclease T1